MRCKFAFFALVLGVYVCASAVAAEFSEGRIRLVIHEGTGRFSVYYLADRLEERWEPVFTASDTGTSFLAVNVNDREYRLGESVSFKIGEALEKKPAVIFESPFLAVREEFRFVKTAGSAETNGIEIIFRIENRAAGRSNAGMRLLLDTNLGEGTGKAPFSIAGEDISFEAAVRGDSGKRWWSSGNGAFSLIGSISGLAAGTPSPDYVQFANWKLMNDAAWKAPFSPGRSFNYPPYSFGDSAVCYYFEPASLESGASLCYGIVLAAVDDGIAGSELRSLLERLDRYIAGEIVLTREEFAFIEQTAAELRASYGKR